MSSWDQSTIRGDSNLVEIVCYYHGFNIIVRWSCSIWQQLLRSLVSSLMCCGSHSNVQSRQCSASLWAQRSMNRNRCTSRLLSDCFKLSRKETSPALHSQEAQTEEKSYRKKPKKPKTHPAYNIGVLGALWCFTAAKRHSCTVVWNG